MKKIKEIKNTKEMTNKEFVKYIIEKFKVLYETSEQDRIIYGNAYWIFTNRKIEIVEPTKLKDIKYNNIITISATTDTKTKLHGKGILDKPKKEYRRLGHKLEPKELKPIRKTKQIFHKGVENVK